MPLQVGLSSLSGTLRAALLGWPSGVMFLGGEAIVAAAVVDLVPIPLVDHVLWAIAFFGVALLALFGLAVAMEAADQGRSQRPRDLQLDDDGLHLRGHGGAVNLAWDDIAAVTCEADPERQRFGMRRAVLTAATLGRWKGARRLQPTATRLVAKRRHGAPVVLATADDAAEVESLHALAESIAALAAEKGHAAAAAAPAPAAAAAATPSEVLACPRCAAPLAPADAATVTCHHCGRRVDMPAPLLARLRAPAELARGRRADRRVAGLLRQPGAGFGNALVGLVRLCGWLVWPAAFGLFIAVAVAQDRPVHGYPRIAVTENYYLPFWRDLLLCAAVVPVLLGGLGAAVAALLNGRRALRLISLDLAAVPPPTVGAPSQCRSCGAPLPATLSERLVVTCLYCGSENLLGVDLRRVAARARRQVSSVSEALRHRRRARLRLAAVLPLAVAAVYLLGREIVFTARWAEKGDHIWGCTFCAAATGHNRDGRPRQISVTDAGRHRVFVVPAHAGYDIECEGPCSVRAGERTRTIEGGEQVDIAGGRLADPPPPAPRGG